MKKIIFNFSNITQFNEQFKLANLLAASNRYELCFLINDYYGSFNYETVINKIKAQRHQYFFSKQIVNGPAKNIFTSILFRLPQSIKNMIIKLAGFDFPVYWYRYVQSKHELKKYSEFLIKNNASLLIVSEDGPGSNFHLIKSSADCNVNSLILPYEYSGLQQMLIGAKSRYNYKLFKNTLTQEVIEKCYFMVDDVYYGFFSIEEIKAYNKTKVLPGNLKTVHGGCATKLAAESAAMEHHYICEKIKKEKIVLTGSVNDDQLKELLSKRESAKMKLYNNFDFDSTKKLIVFSFIPEYPGNKIFKDYHDYISSVSGSLSEIRDFEVVYQFHPAVPESDRKIAYDLNLKICDWPTLELIAVADLYATSYSSTIRWAIAAAVPVLNINMYAFNYEDFSNCRGVMEIKSRKDFDLNIKKLKEGTSLYNDLLQAQRNDAEQWGMQDGNSGERIVQLIDTLCA